MSSNQDSPQPRGQRFILPLIDLLTVSSTFWLVPWLGGELFEVPATAHLFLLPGFVLIVAGVLSIRQLPDYSLNEKPDPSLLGACLVFFVVIIYSMLYVEATDLGGNKSNRDGLTVIIFFVFLLPVLGSFFWPLSKAEPGSKKALVVNAVALFSVNYLTLMGATVWSAFSSLPTQEDPVYATGISFAILYIILYLLFLAFFGLPRLYLLRATGDRIGLTIYLVGVAIFLWDKVPPVN